MIPVAIVLAALVIAVAGGTLYAENQRRRKKETALVTDAADLLKKAMDEGKIQAAAMPGLEGELSYLTDHLAAFENVVSPVSDLEYAKQITGESPAAPPQMPIPREMTWDDWFALWKAAWGKEREEEGYDQRCDFDLNGVINLDDLHLAIEWFTLREPTEGLLSLAQGKGTESPPVDLKSGADPESAAEILSGQGTAGTAALALAHTPGIIAEAASLGQIESVTWTIMDMINASALPDIVKASHLIPYEAAILTPAKYHHNALYRPLRPGIRDLPLMLTRGQISAEEFLKLGAYQGYDGRWSAAYLNTFYTLPGFRELSIMRWRGLIDDTGFKDVMLRLGWHPDVVDEMLNVAWLIPGPGDLIRFVVREVIPPDEFIAQMGKQGYGPGWAGAYWTAHFRLPGPRDLIDAFHRGFIDEAELRKYIFWHDYAPDPRPDISVSDIDIYKSLTKTLIPRVDLRRAWTQGELDDAELEKRYGWLGYEDDAPLMARIQKAIALTPQRGALMRIYLAALRRGVKTEAEVRTKLKELRLPGVAVDMLIEAENVRRAIGMVEPAEELRILSTSQVLAAYKKGLYPWDVTKDILIGQGWRAEDAEVLIAINTRPPEEERPVSQIRTAAAALYKEGFMTGEEFEGRLRAANYAEDDIATLRIAEDLRYRLDYLKDLQATAIEAYRKDIYTAEDLTEYLIMLGLDPDRVAPLVTKEVFKKLPKGGKA